MSEAEAAVLAAANLAAVYGAEPVFRDISLTAGRGEFIGIIGPNGAGKSTLLRCLRGLQPLAAGEVRMGGRPLASMGVRELARTAAYMQQETGDGFGFTAMEVVLTGRYPYLEWWQHEREEDRRIAAKYLAFTGVAHLADTPVRQVSGGERQRILMAKVLAQETPLVFLDEPTASLDLNYQEEVFRYCRLLCRQGKTVLIVAHDIRLAAKFCSRLILLADGRLLADGAPAEVVTPALLDAAYGVHSAVFVNKVTGLLDIHTYDAAEESGRPIIHVIGGGGTAGGMIRALHRRGYPLSGGVFQEGDTDADVARAFGVDALIAPAFSPVNGDMGRLNRDKIAAAGWTVLSNLCYGEQNLDNLAAALTAGRLVVIEDTPLPGRDFTGGRAAALYRELTRKPQVKVMTTAEFERYIAEADEFAAGDDRCLRPEASDAGV